MSTFSRTHQKKVDSEPNVGHVGHGPLDYSAYPHLIEAIAKYADHNARLAIRRTCKSLRDVTDALFPEGEQVILELGALSGEEGSNPEYGITNVSPNPCLFKHRIPALYTLRSLEAASLRAGYDITLSEMLAARLKAMARAPAFTLTRSDSITDDGTPMTQETMIELTKFVRRNIGQNIPLLHIYTVSPPITTFFQDIETLVISTGAYTDECLNDHRWPEASISIKNVAKVVLMVTYNPSEGVFSAFGLPAVLPVPVHFNSPPEDSQPKLVIIFKGAPSGITLAPLVNHWPGVPLGWAHDLVQEIIRNCYCVTFVGALEIPPDMLGFDDHELSGDKYKDAIVETACGMAYSWGDQNDTTKPNWTPELAKTAICNIKFYTHDEYREAVGVDQYDMETKW